MICLRSDFSHPIIMHDKADRSEPAPAPVAPSRPKYRSLDWWLGRTPEQVQAVERDVAAAGKLPLAVRVGVIVFALAMMALLVAAWSWVVLVPTVGMLLLIGIHYLVTGKVMTPPIPIWMHIAFISLIALMIWLYASFR